ncbi:hypothetical protein EUTSA_v10003472mg [Eutrema salsugineum]|uniref:Uncharacterized protein n=1 Tax=Eutrema salsugineum TaxID=72664 RepID=V4LPZ7_EUTSA|nr:hypothetical protein EUTSA_v10003472mg [Eutrema salsugineum]
MAKTYPNYAIYLLHPIYRFQISISRLLSKLDSFHQQHHTLLQSICLFTLQYKTLISLSLSSFSLINSSLAWMSVSSPRAEEKGCSRGGEKKPLYEIRVAAPRSLRKRKMNRTMVNESL